MKNFDVLLTSGGFLLGSYLLLTWILERNLVGSYTMVVAGLVVGSAIIVGRHEGIRAGAVFAILGGILAAASVLLVQFFTVTMR